MKEYYKIGEISSLYNIGTDSLRYYEEIGILSPKRDTNGYRMYSIGDIRTLNVLRELRSIGFSMEEIKNHLSGFNLDSTMDLFKSEIHRIDLKLTELTQLKRQLTYRIRGMEEALSISEGSENIQLKTCPDRKIFALNDNVTREDDVDFSIKKLQKKSQNMLYLIGNGHIGASIPLDYLAGGNYGHYNKVFTILDDDAEDFDEVLPGGKYVSCMVKGSYRQMSQRWQELFEYAKKHDLVPQADPLEIYIIDNHDTSDEEEYVTLIQVPLRCEPENFTKS